MVLLFGREYKDGGRSWRGVSVKSKVFLVSDEKERYLSHIDTQKKIFLHFIPALLQPGVFVFENESLG